MGIVSAAMERDTLMNDVAKWDRAVWEKDGTLKKAPREPTDYEAADEMCITTEDLSMNKLWQGSYRVLQAKPQQLALSLSFSVA